MIGLIFRLFDKPVKPEILNIEHSKSEVITVAPYIENGQEFNRVVQESWKLVLSNETFELLFTDHPEKPSALLDGQPVETEIAHLCVDCFFQSDLEKQTRLIKLIHERKASVENQLFDFNIW